MEPTEQFWIRIRDSRQRTANDGLRNAVVDRRWQAVRSVSATPSGGGGGWSSGRPACRRAGSRRPGVSAGAAMRGALRLHPTDTLPVKTLGWSPRPALAHHHHHQQLEPQQQFSLSSVLNLSHSHPCHSVCLSVSLTTSRVLQGTEQPSIQLHRITC